MTNSVPEDLGTIHTSRAKLLDFIPKLIWRVARCKVAPLSMERLVSRIGSRDSIKRPVSNSGATRITRGYRGGRRALKQLVGEGGIVIDSPWSRCEHRVLLQK